VIKIYWRVTG